jgi:hypothetical protein
MARAAAAAKGSRARARAVDTGPAEIHGEKAAPKDDVAEKIAAKVASDRAERALGRWVLIVLPCVALGGAATIGLLTTWGPALLVLAAATLLGTIALLWASLRTLSGDAPLPRGMDEAAAYGRTVDPLLEQKGTALRALKDIEHEHSIGKLDDADYAQLSAAYRAQAIGLIREMDAVTEPLRARAESVAEAHLRSRGLLDGPPSPTENAAPASPIDHELATPAKGVDEAAPTEATRRACAACATSNEADATFCKKCGASLSAASAEGTDAAS